MLQNPKLTLPPRKNLLRDAAEVETFSSAAFATCTPASFTIERHYFDRTGTTFIGLPCRLCFLICSGTWPVSRLPAAASCAPAGLGALARSMGLPLQKIHAPNLLELAGRKTASYLATPIGSRITVQAAIGEAEATLGAARAYLYEALQEVWDKAVQGYLIDMPGKMKLQLAGTYAVAAAARAVDLVQTAAGTTGIRDEHRFQRYFRDVHTVVHHAYISAARYESGGQYFLGVPIEWPFYGI